MLRPSLFALCALLTITGATAQTMVPKADQEGRPGDVGRQAKQKAQEKFDAADTNKDGKLSREEATAASAYLAEKFDERDKNGDGFLSWEEYVGHDRWPR